MEPYRVESVFRRTSAGEIAGLLVLSVIGVVVLRFVGILYQCIRVYWYLRKLPRPKRVCKGPWFVPEAMVCRYWMDQRLSVTARLFKFFKESEATYKNEDLTVYFYGPVGLLLVNTPTTMEAIVRSHTNVTRPFVYDMMSTLMGVGLLTSPRDVWRHRRRIMNPAFHYRNLHSFVPVINRRCESLVAELSRNEALYSEKYFDILTTITSTTFGVLLETVLGTHVEDTDLQKLGLAEALQGFCSGFMARIVNVLHWWDAMYNLTQEAKHYKRCCAILRNYTRRIMLKRKEELKAKATCKNYTATFLDTLLQMHLEDGSFTEEEVLDETVTIFAAGYDTTASLASYSLYLLGNHADAQERLHEELDATFRLDARRPVTVDDLRRMRYLSCVIKETLRLYPSIPVMGRNIEEDMIIGGQLIPKGTIAMCLIYFLHRHPRFHENPYSFTPERFLNGATGQHPYSYQPFFGGPRNCIGQRFALQEAKIVVAQVMRHFQVESKLPESELQLELGIVLRPTQGLEVRLTPRGKSAES